MFDHAMILLLQSMMLFVGSISDMGTFPDALTADEETQLLEKLSMGDPEAKRKLVEHNLRLVVHIAKRFANTDIDIDDLVSIGTIGLIKAVDKFDPTKKVRLATFASTCIENAILTLRNIFAIMLQIGTQVTKYGEFSIRSMSKPTLWYAA